MTRIRSNAPLAPAKAQNLDGIFAFLFNLLDLITGLLGIYDLFCNVFGQFCPDPPAE